LHQQQEKKKQQHKQKKKKEKQSPKEGDPTTTPVRVGKVTVSRRNEPGVPPTPVAETFLLVGDQRNNGNKNMIGSRTCH
jgi:hypothetical protein